MDASAFIVLGLLSGTCAVVCFQKGKNVLGLLGLAGVVPGLTPLGAFAVAGAFRYAKPSSPWAKNRYSPLEMEAARRQFPEDVPMRPSPVAAGSADPADAPGQGDPNPEESGSNRLVILRFLRRAAEAEVISEQDRLRLVGFLLRSQESPQTTADAESATGQVSLPLERPPVSRLSPPPEFPSHDEPDSVDLPSPTSPPVVAAADVVEPPPPPRPDSSVRAEEPPPAPRRITALWTKAWDAIASDIALHGFAYLGVILTFVGILGFLFFAFVDLPDAVQPFVELAIAFVFFGWAWMLRRQKADRVGDAMELIGGMVVPLIIFAGLVDGAPIPPDFPGTGVVVAFPITSLALAGLYAWIGSRNPESTLRYLVGPLIWLAAMTLGFIFKTDEPLFSDAITRLVSPQPAMASAAIAMTLAACLARPGHWLAAPTVRSALVGVPTAYLLTVSLAVGEGWVLTWPVVLLGVATAASAEALAIWYRRRNWMALARPLLLAGAIGPLTPTVGFEWAAVVIVVAYALLYEIERRRGSTQTIGDVLALTGVAVGLLMGLTALWATLATFTLAWIWSHRLRRMEAGEAYRRIFTGAAAVLPAGVFYGLYGLWGLENALLAMAGIVLALAAYVRWAASGDPFWVYWTFSAALITGVVTGTQWYELGLDGYRSAAALGVIAVSLASGSRWPAWRTWLTAAAASTGLSILLAEAGLDLASRQQVWGLLGLFVVGLANWWRRAPADHVSAVGHLLGTGAVVSLIAGGDSAVVLAAWSAGWVMTAIGDQRGGDTLTSLLTRLVPAESSRFLTGLPLWVVPVFLTASLPLALLASANRWDEFANHRSWIGALLTSIAVVYAVVLRSGRLTRQLRRALGVGAVVMSIIGVSVAAPDPWPTIYAAAGVVAVAALLSGDLRQAWFVWVAWSMTVVIVLLLARQAGVPSDSRHLVSLGWGGLMLIGGLILDDARAGRRARGEGLRIGWVRYPVILGALVFPMSLGPVFTEGLEASASWAFVSAAVYLLAAYLLRVGAVAGPGYALAAVGITGLWQDPVGEDPWLFVLLALPLVGLSWIFEKQQHDDLGGWLRWDLAPLVVAHGVAGIALILAAVGGGLAPTALAFGVLSVVVGLWRRGRVWEEVGNLMMVLAAWDLGTGWLALALSLTSIRGMIGVRLSAAWARMSYQVLATAGAGLGWLVFVLWSDLGARDASIYSIVFFGAVGLSAGLGHQADRLARDTVFWWLGLGAAGSAVTGVLTIHPSGPGIEGAWFAAGLLLSGAGIELAADRGDSLLRTGSVAAVGAAWAALLIGLGWNAPETFDYTALVFGGGALAAASAGRLGWIHHDNALRWGGLGVAGVLVALISGVDPGRGVLFDGPEVAIGAALVAVALEVSWRYAGHVTRRAAVVATGVSWVALLTGLGWDAPTAAIWTSVVFGIGVLVVPELARTTTQETASRSSLRYVGLMRAWAALGAGGVVAGALLSYTDGDYRVSGYWVAASFALLAVASARGAAPLLLDVLREVSPIAALSSVITFAYTSGWSHQQVAIVTILVATVGTMVTLMVWRRSEGSPWVRPLIVLASISNVIAAIIAISLFPERTLLVGVLLSVGIQAIAVGLSRYVPPIVAVGPPLLGTAFILSLSESIGGSAQWFTVPIGVVLLSEVEIFRILPGERRGGAARQLIVFLEWAGLGILSAPALVEMFTVSLFMGLVAVGVAVAVFIWGVATRIRRRVVSAAALAIATMVLMIFAAAAGSAPSSAFFWIVAIGVGFAVLLVAGFVEAYRSKKGKAMARLDFLMEGWE
jgi:hypothetical protein